jgi:hypothetical protein
VSFTRIGDIAARLIADPARLVAAAQDTQRNGGDEPVAQGMCPSPSPMRRAVEETAAQFMNEVPEFFAPYSGERGERLASASSELNKKDGANPASVARGVVRQTTGEPGGLASVESLPVGRSIVMVAPAVAPRKRQAPKVSAMIIDLATYRAVHSPTTQSARSGTA